MKMEFDFNEIEAAREMVEDTGIEPVTSTLPALHSTR